MYCYSNRKLTNIGRDMDINLSSDDLKGLMMVDTGLIGEFNLQPKGLMQTVAYDGA